MRRFLETVVVFSTLAAIASTFLLYRTHSFLPKQTATVIGAEQEFLSITETETIPATTTPQTTQATTSENELNTPNESPSPTKQIEIERLPISTKELDTIKNQIHSLTNLSRSQNKLPNLILDSTLSNIAKDRSQEMIDRNYFSHTSPSGCDISCHIKNSGYRTMAWGENLALSNDYHLYTLSELSQTFISDWLKSDTHRDNLLSRKFTHHGIGIATSGDKIIITVVFAAQ